MSTQSESTVLISSIVQTTETRDSSAQGGPGYSVVSFDPAGEPHAAAIVEAVLAFYPQITSRARPTRADVDALHGQRVTLARRVQGTFGAVTFAAYEGTLFPRDHATGPGLARVDGVVLRPKGTRGVVIAYADILDLAPGYGHTPTLQARVDQTVASLPRVEALTRGHLLDLPSLDAADELAEADRPVPVGLAVMGTWRLGDIAAPGAVWLVTAYDPDDDIAQGYLLVDDAHGCSEHGSIYGRQLLRFGGRIIDPPTLNFSDAFDLARLPGTSWLTRFTTSTPTVSRPGGDR